MMWIFGKMNMWRICEEHILMKMWRIYVKNIWRIGEEFLKNMWRICEDNVKEMWKMCEYGIMWRLWEGYAIIYVKLYTVI